MNQHNISDRRIRLKYKHTAGQRERAIHNEHGIVGVSPGILRVKAIAQERSQRPPSPTIPNWPAIGFPEDGKDSGNASQPVTQPPWEQAQSGTGTGELAYRQPQEDTKHTGWNSQQQFTNLNSQQQANTQSTGWQSQPQTNDCNSHQQSGQPNAWNPPPQSGQPNTWVPLPQAYTQYTGWNSHQQYGQPNTWVPPPQAYAQSTGWNAQPQTNNQPTDGNSQTLAETSLNTQQPGGWDPTVSYLTLALIHPQFTNNLGKAQSPSIVPTTTRWVHAYQ